MPNQAVRDTKGLLLRSHGALLVVDGSGVITDFIAERPRDDGSLVTIAHDRAACLR